MSEHVESKQTVIAAIAANTAIAVIKLVAAALTGVIGQDFGGNSLPGGYGKRRPALEP